MDQFTEFTDRVTPDQGVPPIWVILGWIEEAKMLRPNTLFRDRINRIYKYLNAAMEHDIETMAEKYYNTGDSYEPQGQTQFTAQGIRGQRIPTGVE